MTEEMEKNFKEIEEMHKNGMISDEEYAWQKKDLEDEMARENEQAASVPPPIQQETTSPSLGAAVPPPLPEMPRIHVRVGDREIGAFEREEVIKRIQTGEINRDARVWQKGMPDWVDAGTLPDLEVHFGPPPDSASDAQAALKRGVKPENKFGIPPQLFDAMTGERLSGPSYFNMLLSQHREAKDNRQFVKASAVVNKKLTETSALAAKKFYERGEAFYKNGDYNNAIKELNEAIRLDPNNELAKSVLQKIPGGDTTRTVSASAEKAAVEKPAADPMYSKWRLLRTFEGHEKSVDSVAFSPDGRYIIGSDDITLKLWETVSGRLVRTFKDDDASVLSVAFSPDGQYIAGSFYKTFKLWETASGRLVRTFEGLESYVYSVAFSPDGQYIASGEDTFKLWETASGRLVRTFKGHESSVDSVAFSPDGRHIVSGLKDETLKLWETASGRLVRTFKGHEDTVCSVAFSPDGQYIASGGSFGDCSLKLWETASGRLVRTFKGHKYTVKSVAFSPDGRHIVSGSPDETLKLWETASGRLVHTFEGLNFLVFSVAFSPDGRYIIGSGKKALRLWGME